MLVDHLLNIVKGFKNLKHIHYNELDTARYTHDAKYADSKDLAKGAILEKILKDKAYEIAINSKYDGYQRRLISMMYRVFRLENRFGNECK